MITAAPNSESDITDSARVAIALDASCTARRTSGSGLMLQVPHHGYLDRTWRRWPSPLPDDEVLRKS
jgi:hypothetical protein